MKPFWQVPTLHIIESKVVQVGGFLLTALALQFKLNKQLGFGTIILNILLCCEVMLSIVWFARNMPCSTYGCSKHCCSKTNGLTTRHLTLTHLCANVLKKNIHKNIQKRRPLHRLRPSSSGMRSSATYGTHMISRLAAKLLGLEAWLIIHWECKNASKIEFQSRLSTPTCM